MSAELKYYFSFGQNHFHPETGIPMKDYWVEVIVHEDYLKLNSLEIKYLKEKSRQAMFKRYGQKWSMQYDGQDFNGQYFPKGCYEKLYYPLPEDVTLFTGPFAVGDIVMLKSENKIHHGWSKERKVVRVDDTILETAGYQFVYTIDDNGIEDCNYASSLEKIN